MPPSDRPPPGLDELLIAARAVSELAQVHIHLAGGEEERPLVVVVVRVGDAVGGAELVRTPPGLLRDAVRHALERMSGISTRMSAVRIRQLLAEAKDKP